MTSPTPVQDAFVVEVKGELDRQLSRFSGGADKPAEILILPDASQVVWKFMRDLPAGTLIFLDDKAPLVTVFKPKAKIERDGTGSLKLPTTIFSKKFPYTQSQEYNCVVETSDGITSRTRFENLRGQVEVRTVRDVKKGEMVTVRWEEGTKIWILCDKAGVDRLESLCKLRHDLQHPVCFLPFPFFDTINLRSKLIF